MAVAGKPLESDLKKRRREYVDEKLIDKKRRKIMTIVITIKIRFERTPVSSKIWANTSHSKSLRYVSKNETVPHVAKSKYKNNINISITRVRHFLFVGCDNVLVCYRRQIRLTRDLLLCRAYGVIRLFGVFSVKIVPYNTCYGYSIWCNGPRRSKSKKLISFSAIKI